MRFETIAIHAGDRPDKTYGAIAVPIYQTSNFAFEEAGKTKGYDYSRTANPTRKVLEDTIAQLEGGRAGFAFATGMAAEATVMHLLKTGDHVISQDDIYGGTYRLFQNVMQDFGLKFTFLSLDNRERIEEAVKPNTKMLWLETPSNPLLNIVDLELVAGIARKHKLLTVIDNTFASPYFLRPIEYGIDLVVHSTTKYLNGHCDVVGGAVVTTSDELTQRIQFLLNALGTCAALSKLKIFALAESLGGAASLAEHPATMSHASMSAEHRKKAGINDELIRLSVGLENADDLIEDLSQALE